MTRIQRVGDLEIDQDLRFQRRDWRAQRIGRTLLLLVIVGALFGAFGRGVLSHGRAASADGRLEVEYERIVRHGANARVVLRVRGAAPADSSVEVWLDAAYASGLTVEHMTPEPELARTAADRLVYRFRLEKPTAHAEVVVHTVPVTIWRRRGAIGIVDGPTVQFVQLVLP